MTFPQQQITFYNFVIFFSFSIKISVYLEIKWCDRLIILCFLSGAGLGYLNMNHFLVLFQCAVHSIGELVVFGACRRTLYEFAVVFLV